MHNWYQVLTLQKLAKIVTGDQKAEFSKQEEISPWLCSPVNLAGHVGWVRAAAPYASPDAYRSSLCYSLDHFSWLVWSQQYFASPWESLQSDIAPCPGRRDACLPPWEHRVQEWSCEDTPWRGLGSFPSEKQNRTHPQVFFLYEGNFYPVFLSVTTNKWTHPPTSANQSLNVLCHSQWLQGHFIHMGQILGLSLRFFSFSYFMANISPGQAISDYSWASVCTIPPETPLFPQPLALPCRAWLKASFCLGGARRRPRWDAGIWPDSS